jgi:hypothetical protein
MVFVIRATDKIGVVGFIQPANYRGSRTVGPRATAEEFSDSESAENALAGLPDMYGQVGLKYSVEEEFSRGKC